MESKYYKAPKEPNVFGLLVLFAGVLFTGAVLAPLYLFAIWKATYDILAIAVVCLYVLVLYFVVRQIIQKLILPNMTHNILTFLISYLLLTYVKWSLYCSFIEQYVLYAQQSFSNYFDRFFDFFINPINILAIVRFIYNEGVWTLGGTVINGPVLVVIWLGEFALIALCVIIIMIDKFDLPTVSEGKEWAAEYKEGIIAFRYFKLKDHWKSFEARPSFIIDPQFERIENHQLEEHVRVRLFYAPDHSEHFMTLQEKKYDRRNRQIITKKQMRLLRIDRTLANELMKDISEGEKHDSQE